MESWSREDLDINRKNILEKPYSRVTLQHKVFDFFFLHSKRRFSLGYWFGFSSGLILISWKKAVNFSVLPETKIWPAKGIPFIYFKLEPAFSPKASFKQSLAKVFFHHLYGVFKAFTNGLTTKRFYIEASCICWIDDECDNRHLLSARVLGCLKS